MSDVLLALVAVLPCLLSLAGAILVVLRGRGTGFAVGFILLAILFLPSIKVHHP